MKGFILWSCSSSSGSPAACVIAPKRPVNCESDGKWKKEREKERKREREKDIGGFQLERLTVLKTAEQKKMD